MGKVLSFRDAQIRQYLKPKAADNSSYWRKQWALDDNIPRSTGVLFYTEEGLQLLTDRQGNRLYVFNSTPHYEYSQSHMDTIKAKDDE